MEGEASTSHEVNDNEIPGAVKCRMWKSYCCIPQCHNNNRKNPELSFHKIPKTANLKKKVDSIAKKKRCYRTWSQSQGMICPFFGQEKLIVTIFSTVFSTSSNTPRKSPAPIIPESNPVSEPKATPLTCTQTLISENNSSTENEDTQQKLKDKMLELQAKQVTLQANYE